jgi:hypothetical protein
VSSAATTAVVASASASRGEASPGLPMGTAATVRVPLTLSCGTESFIAEPTLCPAPQYDVPR